MNRGIRVLQTHALPLGYVTILKKRRLLHSKISVLSHVGAEDEARTRYLHLGKVALYQMSYSRGNKNYYSSFPANVKDFFSFFRFFQPASLLSAAAGSTTAVSPLQTG